MTHLVETDEFTAGIYQLEIADAPEGGVNGVDNVPLRQLANRTLYNKNRLTEHLAAADPHQQYMTTAESDAAIANAVAALVAASPAALNTLNELAVALGNDPSFATTITNALAAKTPWAVADAIIDAAGLIPDHNNVSQLLTAITSIIDAAQLVVGEANNQGEEDALFAAGYKIVVRLDLLPTAPDAPTIGTATAGNENASVSLTAPASDGGSPITGYVVTATPGGLTGTGTASPINVPGLTNGIEYTFTAHSVNAYGNSPESAASNAVTPLNANAKLLLHFDGTENGIIFTDSSQHARVMTRVGLPITKTAAPKFGTAYGDFSPTAAFLTTPDAPELRFGASNWTIEGWVKQQSAFPAGSHRFLMSKGASGNLNNAWYFGLMSGGFICFVPANNNTAIYEPYAHKDDTTNWRHISLNSVAGLVTLYVGGASIASCTPGAGAVPAIYEGAGPLYVAGWNYSTTNAGAPLMDEWIITIGQALRTANFTPPTAPF